MVFEEGATFTEPLIGLFAPTPEIVQEFGNAVPGTQLHVSVDCWGGTMAGGLGTIVQSGVIVTGAVSLTPGLFVSVQVTL